MALEDYGWADRMVHRLAFRSGVPQQVLIDMERRAHGEAIAAQPVTAPIFVTSLARAGTTVMLETLASHGDVVTHNHRDMPFVLSPIQWRRMTGRFQQDQDKKERSHGDGLMVNADSPEAFEEIAWIKAFPGHYHADGIMPWDTLTPAFHKEFADLMRALILSRCEKPDLNARYLSKNNANIARLDALALAFPNARFVMPLRRPIDHASSLLKQHRKALATHRESRFARDYAAYAGHFEFGKVHRPILFDGMEDIIARHVPETIDYWLGYWICVYRAIGASDAAMIVDMDRFTAGGEVAPLVDRLGLDFGKRAIADAEAMLRPIRHYDSDVGADPLLLAEADDIHASLKARHGA